MGFQLVHTWPQLAQSPPPPPPPVPFGRLLGNRVSLGVIKTRMLERELPEIGFPMLHGDVVFEHRDRQTSQYPGAVSC